MGKWSRACGECRRRKIRCDETRPTCEKCERLGLSCKDWTDGGIVVFRASNRAPPAVRKRRTRPTSNVSNGCAGQSDDSSIIRSGFCSVASRHASPSPSSIYTISKRPQDAAFAILLEKCPAIEGPKWASVLQILARLPEGSGLQHIVYACSFLCMKDEPSMLRESAVEYGRALTAVNQALQDPVMCTSDDTFLAILNISIYEFTHVRSARNLRKHLSGLITLIAFRGKSSFDGTPAAQGIFREIYLLEASIPLDPHGTPRRSRITFDGDWKDFIQLDPLRSLALLGAKVPLLVEEASMVQLQPINIGRIHFVSSELLDFDQDLVCWHSRHPSGWFFPQPTDDLSQKLPHGAFQYEDGTFRLTLNLVTWCTYRIHVLDSLLALQQYTHNEEGACNGIANTLCKMANDVATISQAFFRIAETCRSHSPTNDILYRVGCWMFIRPLSVALNVKMATIETRRWILDKLISLGNDDGHEEAAVLAKHYMHTAVHTESIE